MDDCRRRKLDAGLKAVEKKLGTLENPPGWVGTAILVRTSMEKEIEVVTMAFAALDRVKPLSCDDAEVKALESVKEESIQFNIVNESIEKVRDHIKIEEESKKDDYEIKE